MARSEPISPAAEAFGLPILGGPSSASVDAKRPYSERYFDCARWIVLIAAIALVSSGRIIASRIGSIDVAIRTRRTEARTSKIRRLGMNHSDERSKLAVQEFRVFH